MDWKELRNIVRDFIRAGHPRLGFATFAIAMIGRAVPFAIGAVASTALRCIGWPVAR